MARRLIDIIARPSTWRTLWVLWAIGLTILSSIPGTKLFPSPFFHFDKIEHMSAFLAGAVCWGLWQGGVGARPLKWWWLPLMCAIFGAIDEVHQHFTPMRSGLDFGDWCADVAGGFLGTPLVNWLLRRWKLSVSKP